MTKKDFSCYGYEGAVFFPVEFDILSGASFGGEYDEKVYLENSTELSASLEKRILTPKLVLKDLRSPVKLVNPIYKVMGFKSWNQLHAKAVALAIYVDETTIRVCWSPPRPLTSKPQPENWVVVSPPDANTLAQEIQRICLEVG